MMRETRKLLNTPCRMPELPYERRQCSRLFHEPPPGTTFGSEQFWCPELLSSEERVETAEKRCLNWEGSWRDYPVRASALNPIEGMMWKAACCCNTATALSLNDRFRVWHDWLHNHYQLGFNRESEIELAERALRDVTLPVYLRLVNYFETVISIAAGFGKCYSDELPAVPFDVLCSIERKANKSR